MPPAVTGSSPSILSRCRRSLHSSLHGWLSPPARCHSRLRLTATGSCRWPAGRMQHGAVSVLWRQISQCQRLEVVRTASQRNSYFGGIALRLRCSPVIIRSFGLRAAAPSLPLPRGLGRGRPLASKLAVCLTSAPIGICGWPWAHGIHGLPLRSLARWRSGARIDFTAPVNS